MENMSTFEDVLGRLLPTKVDLTFRFCRSLAGRCFSKHQSSDRGSFNHAKAKISNATARNDVGTIKK